MKTIIVLAMHGAPPKDFPRQKLGEFFSLHMQLEHGMVSPERRSALEQRCAELERALHGWPRTKENDPFYAASRRLAHALSSTTGLPVVLGFNEFCAPGLDDALDEAVARGGERVIVVTPMMTPGGEHAEIDIPATIEGARGRYPNVDFRYAWPFETKDVAELLAAQVASYGPGTVESR